jgi:radical SAM protein with 4Fe4S-binding SPASM domain
MMTSDIDHELRYQINPAYTLLADRHCAFIFNSLGWSTFQTHPDVDDNFSQLLFPHYASIFAYWNGAKTYRETMRQIEDEMRIQPEVLKNFLQHCFNNPQKTLLHFSDKEITEEAHNNWIPKNFIIECNGNAPRTDLPEPEAFAIPVRKWDMTRLRTKIPTQVTLMLTNRCATDCIYCYADNKHPVNTPLPTEKWLELINEARHFGCLSIDLSGGEVFLHPGVETILKTLHQLGYHPYLSTKIPLEEEQILRLKECGMTELQLSIDCWDAALMQHLLKVPASYFDRMKRTLDCLEKHGIQVKVKAVITRHNDKPEQVEQLLQHLTAHKNIRAISVAPAEHSLYKSEQEFMDYRTSRTQWEKIEAVVSALADTCKEHCEISCQGLSDSTEHCAAVDEKAKAYPKRTRCPGNINMLYVLPDGKVTICEELYWNPRFIIGDVRKQSLMEIWESKEALGLYNLSQDSFRKASACHICPQFDPCHQQSGVCWKMVIEAYGDEYWDLPDPRCPYAPPATKQLYIQ